MININTLNQINDIMNVLNNTRKAIHKSQSGDNFTQTMQQVKIQTPTQTAQQTVINPDVKGKPVTVKKCLYCGKDITGDMPFCDESHASMYRAYGPRRQ